MYIGIYCSFPHLSITYLNFGADLISTHGITEGGFRYKSYVVSKEAAVLHR